MAVGRHLREVGTRLRPLRAFQDGQAGVTAVVVGDPDGWNLGAPKKGGGAPGRVCDQLGQQELQFHYGFLLAIYL